MTDWLQDALNRLVEIEKECPTTPLAANAVPYCFYVQEKMPYWTNRVIGYKMTTNSQDYRLYKCRIGMTYVRAFTTEGVTFQPEAGLYADIPIISAWIGGAIELQSVAYPAQMVNLSPMGAYLSDMRVYLNEMHSGIGAQITGAEFFIDFTAEVLTPQRY